MVALPNNLKLTTFQDFALVKNSEKVRAHGVFAKLNALCTIGEL